MSAKSKRGTNACNNCQKLKRKCNKQLPSCDRCIKTNKRCSYVRVGHVRSQLDALNLVTKRKYLDMYVGLVACPSIYMDRRLFCVEALEHPTAREPQLQAYAALALSIRSFGAPDIQYKVLEGAAIGNSNDLHSSFSFDTLLGLQMLSY
mmetsp:Transcript_14457/g.18358  ORF Transcript_14457/g.18358 Transcript_14457/m.18358 type:complete len:149 (-) Transcript_14457:984-1430(-)